MVSVIKADLLTLIKKHKLVFWVIIISIACSFTVFNMMTGVIAYEIQSAKKASVFHTFTIDLGEQPLDAAMYERLLQTDGLRTAILIKASGNEPLIAGWFGGNDNRWFVLDEGVFFEEKDLNADAAVVSQNMYPGIAFQEGGYTVDVAGVDAEIIGVGIIPQSSILFIGAGDIYEKYYPKSDSEVHYHEEHEEDDVDVRLFTTIIPAQSFLRYGLSANVLRVEYLINDASELAIVSSELKALFPDADILEPELPAAVYESEMSAAAIRAVLIIGCGFVNLVALFTYWLERQRRTHTLYMLLGSTKCFIVKTIMIEWLVMMIFGYLVGLAIQILLTPVMTALSIYNTITMLNTFVIFLVLYAMSMLLMVMQIRRNAKIELEVL